MSVKDFPAPEDYELYTRYLRRLSDQDLEQEYLGDLRRKHPSADALKFWIEQDEIELTRRKLTG